MFTEIDTICVKQDDRLGFHDDDDVYDMDPETEASLHFGGGFQPKSLDTSTSKDEEPQRKSKKQVAQSLQAFFSCRL